jgi:hypothetical protein
VRYKNKVSLGDRELNHLTRVHIRRERERGAREWLAMMTGLADRVAAADGAAVPDDLRRMRRGRKLAEDAFNEAAAYFLEPLRPELAARGYELLWNLMAGSFLIGASATMSKSAKQKVERDINATFKDAGAKGGRKGARTNSALAEARWRGEARLLVKEIWDEGPAPPSQDTCTEQVLLRWKGKQDDMPDHRQVKRLIAAMQKSGEISRKKVRT